MSKRILFLLMLAFTCAFMLVGCGDDGSDGAPGSDADASAMIAALQAQLDAGLITIAEYEEAIAALQEQLNSSKLTQSESCATCHADIASKHGSGKYILSGAELVTPDGGTGATTGEKIHGMIDYENTWSAAITNVATVTTNLVVTLTVNTGDDTLDVTNDKASVAINFFNTTGSTVATRWTKLVSVSNLTWTNVSGNSYTLSVPLATAAAAPNATQTLNDYLAAGYVMFVSVAALDASDTSKALAVTRGTSLKDGFRTNKIYVPVSATVNSSAVTAGVYNVNSTANPRNFFSDVKGADGASTEDRSCIRCHGEGEFTFHHNSPQQAYGNDCNACHIGLAENLSGSGHAEDNGTPSFQSNGNTAFVGRIHGVHSGTTYDNGTNEDEDGNLAAGYDGTGDGVVDFTVGLPANIADCRVCHASDTQYANATNNARMSEDLCITCHGAWDNVPFSTTSLKSFHMSSTVTAAINGCQTCHTGATGSTTLASIHVKKTETGLTFNPRELAKKVNYQITGISRDVATNVLTITWKAYDPTDAAVKYDVKNTAADKPEFFRSAAERTTAGTVAVATDGMQILVGYYGKGTQDVAARESLTGYTALSGATTYDAGTGVATTKVSLKQTNIDTYSSTKLLVALIGMPVWNGYAVATPSVTKEFNMATTAMSDRVTTKASVSETKCNDCHNEIIMHQSRHSAVGSPESCMLCHNPASAAGHFATQSRNLNSYVHAIHAGQNEVGADPLVHGYPRALMSCGACHLDGSAAIDVPTLQGSLPAVVSSLEKSGELDSTQQATTGPAANACGSCHNAMNISEDLHHGTTTAAGLIAQRIAHTTTFGFKALISETPYATVLSKIYELFE